MRKNGNKHSHLKYIFNLCIPTTPQYGYAVCHGVLKSNTVPVPVLPILETLQVYLYLY